MNKVRVGDTVRCIDNGVDNLPILTVGESYEVIEVTDDSVVVIKDNGDKGTFFKSRFVLDEGVGVSMKSTLRVLSLYLLTTFKDSYDSYT